MTKQRIQEILKMGLRIFGYQVAFGFIGFMVIPSLMSASSAIRIPIVGLFVAAGGLLLLTDGMSRGARDCAMSETLDKLEEKGRYQATDAENAKRFYRSKAFLAALAGALPTLLLSILVAVTAKPYAYTIQDLPSWMSSYVNRPEIGDALVYMRGELASASVFDYMRIVVRFLLFPFVGLFGTLSDEMSLVFDYISPLLALVLPMLNAIGYQFGPSRRAKEVKAIEEAKNTPRKRLKKDRKRGEGPKEKKQLI